MTLRELDWRLAAIGKRKDDDFRAIAAIHGVKLKGSPGSQKVSEKNKKIISDAQKGRYKWGR